MARKRSTKIVIAKTGMKRGVKRYNKKKAQLKNKTSVSFGLGFPKRCVVTHKYAEQIQMTTTAGAASTFLFTCNGMFKPNFSGTGHQPMYFDQMSAIYDHYTVIGSKVNLSIVQTTTADGPSRFGMFLNDDTAITTTALDPFLEQTSGCFVHLPPGGTKPYRLTKKWSAKKTFGGSVLGNDNLQGTIASNPSEQTYFNFVYQADGATTSSVWVEVQITYIAVWDELKDLAQS